MHESSTRRGVLALLGSASLAGCSSVLSSSDENDPDCGMLGDPDAETDLPDDMRSYDVSAQLVTEETREDPDLDAMYQEVPEDATVVPYACLEGRDVESLRRVVRDAVDHGGITARNEVISEAEAERIDALLPDEEGVNFVSYDGRVAHVYLSYTFGTGSRD